MSALYKVVYSPEALEDIASIYSYIAFDLQAGQAAIDQTKRILGKIRLLDSNPQCFSQVEWEPWLSLGMRKYPIDNYLAFYITSEKTRTVTIVRVFYGGRDVEGIMNPDNDDQFV